jgi:hypothetical protein
MSASPPAVLKIDDDQLIGLVQKANRRLLIMAPGLTDRVAKAVCERWPGLGPQAVNVILDVDPEVCRLGYGTLELYFPVIWSHRRSSRTRKK